MPPYRSPIPLRPEHAYLHGDLDAAELGTGHFTFVAGAPTDTPTHAVTGCAYTFAAGMTYMHEADAVAAHHQQEATEGMATERVKSMQLASLALVQQYPATVICEIHTLRSLLHQALQQLLIKEIKEHNEEVLLADAQRQAAAWKRMYYSQKAAHHKTIAEIHDYKAQIKSLNNQLRHSKERLEAMTADRNMQRRECTKRQNRIYRLESETMMFHSELPFGP